MARFGEITGAIVGGDRDTVLRLVNEELGEGRPLEEILNEGLVPGMEILGERFGKRGVRVDCSHNVLGRCPHFDCQRGFRN